MWKAWLALGGKSLEPLGSAKQYLTKWKSIPQCDGELSGVLVLTCFHLLLPDLIDALLHMRIYFNLTLQNTCRSPLHTCRTQWVGHTLTPPSPVLHWKQFSLLSQVGAYPSLLKKFQNVVLLNSIRSAHDPENPTIRMRNSSSSLLISNIII